MSNQFQNHQMVTSPSDSSDTIAMMLEIVFGIFGILGMGWLYAGNIPVAIGAFVGFLILALIEMAIATLTLGFAACFILPVNLSIAVVSGIKARDYVRNTGAHGSVMYVILGVVLGVLILCVGFMLFAGLLSALGPLGALEILEN